MGETNMVALWIMGYFIIGLIVTVLIEIVTKRFFYGPRNIYIFSHVLAIWIDFSYLYFVG